VPKSVTMNDLERQNGPYFFFILPNLVVYGARCVKVLDKAITTDNLRLLCLVKKPTAEGPRDAHGINILQVASFVADSCIQELIRSTCLTIV